MELIRQGLDLDFMSRRRVAVMVSAGLLVISALSLAFRGLEFGIDFTGGTLVEVGYPQAVELEPVRATLAGAGFEGALVQHFGTAQDVLIRIAPRDDMERSELSNRAFDALRAKDSSVDLRRVEFVGPQVGEELTEQGGLAMLIALGAIFIYVMFRFEWKFSAGAVAALFHDVLITLGIFSVLGLEFDLTVLAAILAVIGYSLNDTIVVFDRIRENFRRMRRGTSESIINRSLNQTLSRTLMTSLTTLLVLIALFFLGGELIHGFATTLIIGVLIGTYSSIYVASTCTLWLGVQKADLMPVQKEGAEELDTQP
ncbi:MAG: protein translocase subunit SecF [Thiotrichales bacterium]|nr:protein translocase subunit SecF [Thiotrichales bacterium]MCY4285041.1 protein translocase subunit SecF [Thiotrichales bacterium]MCY4350813.1 protein translocase subunit SecF [Thiotrichales bacterium]